MDRHPGEDQEGDPLTQAAPGVFLLRLPLPFRLDHVNVWLLQDGDGWTAVDTGIDMAKARELWRRVLSGGRPLKRIIVTHFHPDHIGLAGWLAAKTGAELWMTRSEWAIGRMLELDRDRASLPEFLRFYRAAGFDGERMEGVRARGNPYPERITPIPGAFRCLGDGDRLMIGEQSWRVMVGRGHSPEHAALYCEKANILLSGDQILPRISPNVSVWPQEPDANPLRLFLDSLEPFQSLPNDCLVLPGHDLAFRGLHDRIDQLAHHHEARLKATLDACARPASAVEALVRLFDRKFDEHELYFALGETIAHLHFLLGEGKIDRMREDDGIDRYVRRSTT